MSEAKGKEVQQKSHAGIPPAKFVESAEEFVGSRDVDEVLGEMQELMG